MTKFAAYPLLTIAIPTWNRAPSLALTLAQLAQEACNDWGSVELLVSDNASSDGTGQVVSAAVSSGMPLRYIKNTENIGSDANIAQCFNLAKGHYVLILGDDDVLIDGALKLLLTKLASNLFGVVCLRAYGFDSDFREEYPGTFGKEHVFVDAGLFLASIGARMTLISSCVISKSLLGKIDAREFIGDNLVQLHLVLRAALAAQKNLFLDKYLVACRRNNSGGYDFSDVFVTNLGGVLDSSLQFGLKDAALLAIENRFLKTYYPYYILRQRLYETGDLRHTLLTFQNRFQRHPYFKYWVRPIIYWPRYAAIVWGCIATFAGRTSGGDFRRGVGFVIVRLSRALKNELLRRVIPPLDQRPQK